MVTVFVVAICTLKSVCFATDCGGRKVPCYFGPGRKCRLVQDRQVNFCFASGHSACCKQNERDQGNRTAARAREPVFAFFCRGESRSAEKANGCAPFQ